MAALANLLTLARNSNQAAIATIFQIGQLAGLTNAQIDAFIGSGAVSFSPSEIATARGLVVALNNKIEDVVGEQGSHMTYVNPLTANSPFNGHDLCAETPYFNGLDLAHTEYSYHPNAAGQDAYRRLLRPYLQAAA